MIGLMVLMFFAVYLGFSVLVTSKAADWAKTNNKKPWVWAGLTAFMMYNLVFWDLIPTLAMHKYYCSTQAGFWVYKTPEQWVKENPGVADTLTWKDLSDSYSNNANSYGYYLNERFSWDSNRKKPFQWIPIFVHEDLIVDRKTHEVLARKISIGSGYGSLGVGKDWQSVKFWLSMNPCVPSEIEFANLKNSVKKLGEKK